jgi:hypothetical protein
VREHQHRAVRAQGSGDFVRLQQLQAKAALAAQRLGDVEVGGEVAAFAQDHVAPRAVRGRDGQRRAEHLVQVDRSAVGGHHLARAGADQAGDPVAQPLRQIEPAGAVPRADQAFAPFLLHGARDALGRGPGQRSQ